MEIAKALILAGCGGDDRTWSTAAAGSRHLFPVANRPILFHNLEALRAAGVLEAAILAAPDARRAIQRAVGDGSEWGLVVRFAPWRSSIGLGGALAAGRSFIGDEPVLVQHADALLRERMHAHISAFAREGLDALALRLRECDGRHEEPPAPGYLLSPRAVSILAEGRGLAANPIAGVRAHGGRVRVQDVDGCLACHGDHRALLESNRRMLEGLTAHADPGRYDQCSFQGPVDIHPTAHVERSLLRGPVVIGPGARVSDAYVGPYTSIGADVVIEGAEIEYSIVLPEAELRFVGTRLESSVIGRGARIARRFDLPGAIRMSIGDGAEVVLR
jgi:glucose-1-phosphate thymidylyltransferase